MTMKMVNIFQAKAGLSQLIDAVGAGERVVICNRNRPVAELIRVSATRTAPRPIGGARGQFSVPPAFFEPLPDEVIDTFYPGAALIKGRAAEVAERGPGHRKVRARARRIPRRTRR